jgi:hypothetical protein
MHPHSIFIPSEKLGVLEAHIRAACTEETRRKRANRTREVVALMRRLHLIPHHAGERVEVVALGLGCDTAGAHGALVVFAPMDRQLPAGAINE